MSDAWPGRKEARRRLSGTVPACHVGNTDFARNDEGLLWSNPALVVQAYAGSVSAGEGLKDVWLIFLKLS